MKKEFKVSTLDLIENRFETMCYDLTNDLQDYIDELLTQKGFKETGYELDYDLSYGSGDGVQLKDIDYEETEVLQYHFKDKQDFDYIMKAIDKIEGVLQITDGALMLTTDKHMNITEINGHTFKKLSGLFDRYEAWGNCFIIDNAIEPIENEIIADIQRQAKKYGYELVESEEIFNTKTMAIQDFFEINSIEAESYEHIETMMSDTELKNINKDEYMLVSQDNGTCEDYYIKKLEFDDLKEVRTTKEVITYKF